MESTTKEKLQLFQVVAGHQTRSSDEGASSQRFLQDVKYADYFAKRIGECLGMRRIDLGVVEDAETQSAFVYASGPGGDGSVVNGLVTAKPKRFSALVEELLVKE